MRLLPLNILATCLLACCSAPQDDAASKNNRLALPYPDRDQQLKYEAIQKLRQSGCLFSDPDTSLAGIKLKDAGSALAVFGESGKADSLGQYYFYSEKDRETLILSQYPNDTEPRIEIFTVVFSDKADYGYSQLPIDTFKTEKGIKLGMSKKEIVNRLGHCYAALDSTKGYIELYYCLEAPNHDSRTKILSAQQERAYFASYKLCNDRLERFSFGFMSIPLTL